MSRAPTLPLEALHAYLRATFPDASIEAIRELGADETAEPEITRKGFGYGRPLRIQLRLAGGGRRDLVFHTEQPDEYGHDRRADRAANVLLAYDTFGQVPQHAPPVDVGAIARDGSLRSLGDCGELFLLTEHVPGRPYADDLRAIAHRRSADERDVRRCDALATYLAALHARSASRPVAYTRAIRDLIGDGEGIYGIVDGYPPDAPAAPPSRLRAIEERCATWRWRLRGSEHRLAHTHGDFHPFNILFADDDQPRLLDASRGTWGEPADDVTCLAVNYVFFALAEPGAWDGAFRALWHRFWRTYQDHRDDPRLLDVAPPFLAWRLLVLANPSWYPAVDATARDRLLTFAERALDAGHLDLETAEEVSQ